MGQIQERKKRIQILLALLVIGGFFWYAKFGEVEVLFPATDESAPAVSVAQQPPLTGPAPSAFQSFMVPGDSEIGSEISCGDSFYTILVFPVGADYRKDPRGAVYNSANSCAKGEEIEVRLAPSSLGIPAGEYYLVIADQGVSGSWYNPR